MNKHLGMRIAACIYPEMMAEFISGPGRIAKLSECGIEGEFFREFGIFCNRRCFKCTRSIEPGEKCEETLVQQIENFRGREDEVVRIKPCSKPRCFKRERIIA